ncbi:hypothetical protein [Portibacter lacus]|uniref:Uncharacterized protein n=1 Tax=Portibacter lacus TaxID=1099794 RepID=A0AA37WE94_9BACT|nr:hypothetical protein [Portibacter lacus]GLR17743.1 hypothetical protein GCM10007940_23580 [Portibacter lacus]
MKKSYLLIAFISLTVSFQSSLLATNPISVEVYNQLSTTSQERSIKNHWQKAKTWLVKKWFKTGAGISIEKLANAAIIIGSLSLVVLIVSIFAGLPYLILVGFGMALIGDILAIMLLQKTKHKKDDFRKERRKAWFGLVFSLLTGLLPLALLGIVLALLSIG